MLPIHIHAALALLTPLQTAGSTGWQANEGPVLVSDESEPFGKFTAFGADVELDEDRAIVGASGGAYVFERDGSAWHSMARVIGSDTVLLDYFGASVAIDGDTLVVGAPRDDHSGAYDAGSAYVFARDPETQAWEEVLKLTLADPGDGDAFGSAGVGPRRHDRRRVAVALGGRREHGLRPRVRARRRGGHDVEPGHVPHGQPRRERQLVRFRLCRCWTTRWPWPPAATKTSTCSSASRPRPGRRARGSRGPSARAASASRSTWTATRWPSATIWLS